ncbi:hypothetical protein ACMAVI_001818 [Burkholderia cenocepacia]
MSYQPIVSIGAVRSGGAVDELIAPDTTKMPVRTPIDNYLSAYAIEKVDNGSPHLRGRDLNLATYRTFRDRQRPAIEITDAARQHREKY